MKRFKIGFLAIIALVAMSFTVANQMGYAKNNFTISAAGCYETITPTPAVNDVVNTSSGSLLQSGFYCENASGQPVCCYEVIESPAGTFKVNALILGRKLPI